MSADSVMIHVRLNKNLKTAVENTAESFGLSLSGLVKVLLTGVVNTQKIPSEFLAQKTNYEDFLTQKISSALESKKIAPEEANRILGFDVDELIKKLDLTE